MFHMTEYFVDRVHEGDAVPIHNLATRLSPLTPYRPSIYRDLFRNFGDSCFVAIANGEDVGFIASHPTTTPPKEWFIWQVGILPDHRGEGLVDTLQDRVLEVARKSSAIAITTVIEADNSSGFGAFSRMAKRIGSTMNQIDSFSLSADVANSNPEIVYRIPLES